MARHPFLNKIDPDAPIFSGATDKIIASRGPWFTISQTRKIFFPWRSVQWLRYLEDVHINPPEFITASGARAYSLVDVERIARELEAARKPDGKPVITKDELRKVLLAVKAIAVNYDYEVSR